MKTSGIISACFAALLMLSSCSVDQTSTTGPSDSLSSNSHSQISSDTVFPIETVEKPQWEKYELGSREYYLFRFADPILLPFFSDVNELGSDGLFQLFEYFVQNDKLLDPSQYYTVRGYTVDAELVKQTLEARLKLSFSKDMIDGYDESNDVYHWPTLLGYGIGGAYYDISRIDRDGNTVKLYMEFYRVNYDEDGNGTPEYVGPSCIFTLEEGERTSYKLISNVVVSREETKKD